MATVARYTCALLADEHTQFVDGVRGLLSSAFSTVYLVADIGSLTEGAHRLRPDIVIVDLNISRGDFIGLLKAIKNRAPSSKLLTMTVHDQPTVATTCLEAGADAVVLKRCIGIELLEAVDTVLNGAFFVSPDIGLSRAEVTDAIDRRTS